MISRLLCWLGLHRWVTDRPYFLALKPSETPAICSRCHLTRNGYHQAARLAAVKADYDAEIDRLRACRDELRDVTEAMDDPTINNTRTLVEAVRDLRLQRDSWRREAELNAEAADQSATYARQLAEAERALAAARGLQEGTAQLLAEAREHQTCEGGKPYVCHALATARSELAEAERALDGAQQQLYEFAGWLSEHGENLCGMPNAEIIDIVDRFRAQRRELMEGER